MKQKIEKLGSFDLDETLHTLAHYLPAQAPLKDFIHHNTLHAFQDLNFFEGASFARTLFGYKTLLSLNEFKALFENGFIKSEQIDRVIMDLKLSEGVDYWKKKLLTSQNSIRYEGKVGKIRKVWKDHYHFDISALTHHILFRIVCNYLDQGISIWKFPTNVEGLLNAVREIENGTSFSFFRSRKGRELILDTSIGIRELLERLVGSEENFESYLYDLSFAHQGWSGMVAHLESNPNALLDRREISLKDFIHLELIFELDAAYSQFGEDFEPLGKYIDGKVNYLEKPEKMEGDILFQIWQEAFEWSYYDTILFGIQQKKSVEKEKEEKTFQAVFCIDDREGSIRRYVEKLDSKCETFGMPGFFGVEFYFQPEGGKFIEKVCPAPVTPKYLIKEVDSSRKTRKEIQFNKNSHHNFFGWVLSIVLGFWSALKLVLNIFRPGISPATSLSFRHMVKDSTLTVEHHGEHFNELQVGFTLEEMTNRVEGSLRAIGLISDFAPLVYFIGHGASSVNNPHYSAYDCGACSGRAGSANARVISQMANHPDVRKELNKRGIVIPDSTQFVGGLRDTTRDQTVFYDGAKLSESNYQLHQKNKWTFRYASDMNAKERSRRFDTLNTRMRPWQIHKRILRRSVSIFEPRPELNHATNALCIVGRREITKHLFMDRRAFMNSYNPKTDPHGKYLYGILKAAAPVCGGINLEYFFSRTDNQKLGAGTKLPHNVMGLIGVANGVDGDLRPGLPSQMIEVHDPIRLLIVVEQNRDVVKKVIQTDSSTFNWFEMNWVHLVCIDPDNGQLFRFMNGEFVPYSCLTTSIPMVENVDDLIEKNSGNIPAHLILENHGS
ncbi:MAG: hypothetical protein RL092_109 [Bacteroidota bacterium]|jgi:uncharacterized protein YbcC (UPF0753/DUF2309 family)